MQKNVPKVKFNLGYATWASDSAPQLAVEQLSRAVQADPSSARCRHQLALAFARLEAMLGKSLANEVELHEP